MLVILNNDIPARAKEMLIASVRNQYPDAVLLELETEGIIPASVSGFPCMFFCPIPGKLVVAPDLPERYVRVLRQHKVNIIQGSSEKPETRNVRLETFNALITPKYLIHNLPVTDPVILQNCHYLKKIPVKQGFTRSHLLSLRDNHFITSDKGIGEVLHQRDLEVIYISPVNIQLPGHENGGIGGAAGVFGDTVVFNGSLSCHPEGEKIRNFLERLEYRILELEQAPLTDAGGILFT